MQYYLWNCYHGSCLSIYNFIIEMCAIQYDLAFSFDGIALRSCFAALGMM